MNDIKLKYYYYENIKKPCLLFLHGFMGLSSDWDAIVVKLKNDYSILLIDLPGHGLSINLPKIYYTFNKISEQFINIIKYLKIKTLNIIAYSMGGRLVLDLIFNSEIKINKIIFESVSFGINNISDKKSRLNQDKLLCDNILNNNFVEFLKSWYELPIWGNLNKSNNYNLLLNKRLLNNKHELCKSLNNTGIGYQKSYLSDLNILNNMLYITGEYDIKYNNIAYIILELNKNIKHINVTNTGHNVHFQEPIKYVEIIKQYLNEN